MTFQSRPEYEAPPELRCEALIKGKNYVFEWMKHDHQCPRKANQCRSGRIVCFQHASVKEIVWWNKLQGVLDAVE